MSAQPSSAVPSQALFDAIYLDKVRRARRTPPGQKFVEGIELFEQACGFMRSGIRANYPDADDQQVEEILRRQLRRLRQVAEHGIYRFEPLPEDV